MTYLYAILSSDLESVEREYHSLTELTEAEIKHVNGEPLARPLVVVEPTYDPVTQIVGVASYTIEADKVTKTWAVANKADIKEPLKAYLAAKRYEIETGGITFNGAVIQTTRDSQSMIAGAYAVAQRDPEAVIQYKAVNGFVTLDAVAMTAVAVAVAEHVQACFAKEAELSALIDDGTVTTTAQIDNADWPS